MKSKAFTGISGVQKVSPNGGKVSVSFGYITTEGDENLEAIAIQIADENKETVAEFAMLPDTFGTLIEAIKELYDGEFGDAAV